MSEDGRAHALLLPDAETERAVVASLLDDGGAYLETWQRLDVDAQLRAWQRLAGRGLGLLATLTAQHLAQAQANAGTAQVAPWVRRAIEAARATELNDDVLVQAWLADYHDEGVRRSEGSGDEAIGAQQAVLGSQLLMGHVDGDTVRVRALLAEASPSQARESLVQLTEAVVLDLSELTGADAERVFAALLGG